MDKLCVIVLLLCGLSLGLEIEVDIEKQVACYGGSDGVATVFIVDGEPPYKYFWPSTNDNTQTSSRLSAGSHNVTVKDANSVVTKSFVILQPAKLEATQYQYSTLQSCDSLGTVSASAHGGTPPYTYNWVALDIHVDPVIMAAVTPIVIFDEVLSPTFKTVESQGVDLHSSSVPAYSGLWSVRISSLKPTRFDFMCANASTCVDLATHRGMQFWMWMDDSEGRVSAGLLDKDGGIVSGGANQFGGFAPRVWTMGYLSFAEIPQDSYAGVYFLTDDSFDFHLDDIVILPKEENFLPTNSSSALVIGTPTAIYGPAGDYSLRVLDDNQCHISLSLDIEHTLDLESIVQVDDLTVTVATNGGSPPYAYNLSSSSNSTSSNIGIFTDVPVGNYTLLVTDSRGCNVTLDVTVLDHGKPPVNPLTPGYFSKYKVVNGFLATLAGLFSILTIVLSVLVHKRRNDLRPHSRLFCQTILIGAFLGYIAAILAVLGVNWARCVAFSWTVDSSVTIIYGSMFAKSMQILKILDNFTKFVSIDTTDRYMAKVFCFIIIPELLLLVLWSGLTGLMQKKITAGQGEVIFWNIFLVYKGIVGFVASFVCFRMRFKFKEYLEIQQIAYCHFTLEFVLVFLLVFTMIAREKYNELFVGVQSFSVIVMVSIPLLVIFLPIVRRAIKDLKDENKTKRWQKLTMYT